MISKRHDAERGQTVGVAERRIVQSNLAHSADVGKASAKQFGDIVAFPRPTISSSRIEYTVLEAGTGRASPAKTFGVSADGAPTVTQDGQQPAAGTVRRETVAGSATDVLSRLAVTLEAMSDRRALVCAPPPTGQDVWEFVSQREARDRTDVISRSAAHFPAPAGPALFGLDLDVKGWPPELLSRVKAFPEQIAGVLATVAPTFGDAAGLVRASSSAGVRNRESGQETDRGAGQHRFYIGSDGREIARAVTALHERLILAGWGYGFVFESGYIDVRSLIDRSASIASERLWFEGQVKLADPRLELVPNGRKAVLRNEGGGTVDLSTIADLSTEERTRFDAVCDAIRKPLQALAETKRRVWKEKRRAELIAKGVGADKADKIVVLALESHQLADDFLISFDDGTSATVSEILADPMAFHRMTGPDPLEPEYGGGRNKAILFGDGQPVRIESQAHGGIRYVLVEIERYFENPAPTSTPANPSGPLFAEGATPVDIFGDADPAELGDPPAGSLPPVVELWARSEARRKGVQVAFPAVAAITALASAVGSSLKIRVRQYDDWNEPASLWTVLIAPPGSAKSPIISAAAGPLRKLDGEWLRVDGPIHAEWVKASKGKRKADAPSLGPEPRIRRAVVDDVTSERIVGIFADNPNGLLRDTDELAALLGGLGAYKKGSDGDRSQLLRLFDGGSISRDRQTVGSTYAESALMGILAGSQPQKIAAIVKDLGTDGLLQRFLFVLHDGVERRGIDEAPDREAVAAYERIVRGLKAAEYGFTEPLRLTPEAGAALHAAGERLDGLRHLPGAGPAFQDHVAKWGKFLPRLVLTFHAVEAFQRDGRVNTALPIELQTVESAVRFGDFLMLHSIRFYETFFGTPETVSEARWVAGFLLTRPELREIGRRDIYDARKNLRGPDFRPLLAVMGELEHAGWIETVKRESDGPSRWIVNGRIHSRFAARADREARDRSVRHARMIAAGHERRRLSGAPDDSEDAPSISGSVFD